MIITGAVYISQLLNVTHTLQDLSISDNDIGDDGMAVISEALQHNKSLTTLMVEECGLSVKGWIITVIRNLCGFIKIPYGTITKINVNICD